MHIGIVFGMNRVLLFMEQSDNNDDDGDDHGVGTGHGRMTRTMAYAYAAGLVFCIFSNVCL